MSGDSKLEVDSTAIDDASNGNNNGVINRNECVKLNVTLVNDGCANETAISGLLTTSTPNVTITQNSSAYPNLNIDVHYVHAPNRVLRAYAGHEGRKAHTFDRPSVARIRVGDDAYRAFDG